MQDRFREGALILLDLEIVLVLGKILGHLDELAANFVPGA